MCSRYRGRGARGAQALRLRCQCRLFGGTRLLSRWGDCHCNSPCKPAATLCQVVVLTCRPPRDGATVEVIQRREAALRGRWRPPGGARWPRGRPVWPTIAQGAASVRPCGRAGGLRCPRCRALQSGRYPPLPIEAVTLLASSSSVRRQSLLMRRSCWPALWRSGCCQCRRCPRSTHPTIEVPTAQPGLEPGVMSTR